MFHIIFSRISEENNQSHTQPLKKKKYAFIMVLYVTSKSYIEYKKNIKIFKSENYSYWKKEVRYSKYNPITTYG